MPTEIFLERFLVAQKPPDKGTEKAKPPTMAVSNGLMGTPVQPEEPMIK